MSYDELRILRRIHPGWRLLAADHAPMIVDFLNRTFVEPNVRTFAEQDLASRLEDYLFQLVDRDQNYPKPAIQYLKDWAQDDRAWLRKYYPENGDEPHYDLTPSSEKAIRWIASLEGVGFVGAESRLMTVFALLKEIVEGSETDPEARIAELEKKKAAIDLQIQEVRDGRIALLDGTRVRERFLQMADTARGLLADFRQVEQNFRQLDRQVREKVANWEGGKGEVLEEVFGEHDAITDSDQGRSFRAFWDFLMSPARQEELARLLERVLALDEVLALEPDRRLRRIHYDWLAAGEVTQRTVARLSEQLRRYLDDQAWLENRRIMTIIRQIEQHGLAVRKRPPAELSIHIDALAPDIELPLERPLFKVPVKPYIDQQLLSESGDDVDVGALFEQVYVDKAQLRSRIQRALQFKKQVSLLDIVSDHPLELGLSELVAYVSLASEDDRALIDDSTWQIVGWTDGQGRELRARVPTVIFAR